MIFPTNQPWKDLERATKISLFLAVLIYLLVATIGYFKPGPSSKDQQVYAFVSSNYELGLNVTKGYNLSGQCGYSGVQMGDCEVYVMSPPIYHILLTGVYAISGQDWRALRIGPIFFGLIYLYACLALAVKFFKGRQRSWLLFFALTPMILIYSAWNTLGDVTMGILIISYLCFANYLESGKLRWVAWSGAFYLLAFWIDYLDFAIVPAMILQLLFHPGLTRRERRIGLAIFAGFVALGALVSLAHFSALPGGFEWFIARITWRFSSQRPEQLGGTYSLLDFIARQSIRFITHYTPISLFLVGWALLTALAKFLRHKKIVAHSLDGRVAVDPLVALLVLFSWGVPIQLAINAAYIHPVLMYYFTAFFPFGSVIGLYLISEKIRSSSVKQYFVTATLVGFLFLSIGRSVYNLTGGSLYDLATGANSGSAQIYTIEELRQCTCRSWQLK